MTDTQELFSPAEIQQMEDALPALVSGKGDLKRFSGAFVERQRELVESVLSALGEGQSQRRIARAFGLSRNTVRGILERAQDSGKLEPHKQRFIRNAERISEASQELILEWLDEDKIKPSMLGQLSVAGAIQFDKRSQAAGEAGLVIEHRHSVDVEDFRARLEAARDKMVSGAVTTQPPANQVVDVQEVTDNSS